MRPTLTDVLCSWRAAFARRAAKAYYAGPELADAMRVCSALFQDGIASTLCYWNGNDDAPDLVSLRYLDAIGALADYDAYLSVKAPALQFRPDLLAPVVEAARGYHLGIHFDSHACEQAGPTIDLISRFLASYRKLSTTLPGRWRRSLRDADWVVQSGVRVRVVKGQWEDTEMPSLDPSAGFLAVVGRLAGRACRVGVATHDAPLARQALEFLLGAGTPCELELLFGLPLMPGLAVARQLGVPVRLYVPYGRAWLPYCLSRAAQNPRYLLWFLRDWVLGGHCRIPPSLSAPPPSRRRAHGWDSVSGTEVPTFHGKQR